MVDTLPGGGNRGPARKQTPTIITNAKSGTSREMASREKRYVITMAIRTACFISMIFVPGPMRWVLLAGAVFLPYIAVVFANQADTKTKLNKMERAEPSGAAQLTVGEQSSEVIHGEILAEDVTSDHADRQDRVA